MFNCIIIRNEALQKCIKKIKICSIIILNYRILTIYKNIILSFACDVE